ncbi:hypothetical protein MKX01_039312 [Papaver californicum]|nr:hypothetical protein MKX01_039312 [Papaver californicum]
MAEGKPEIEVTEGEVAPVVPEVAAEKKPNRLDRKWTLWCDNQSKPKQGAAWGSSLRKVFTFDSVEDFWCLYDQIIKPSKLVGHADFHLFRDGVEPKWEDPECASGGKWSVSCKRASLDSIWLETLMALIGEQFDEGDEICGAVASVRTRQDKVALWTRTASNEATQMSIGRRWKDIIDITDKISYSVHEDAKRERSVKSRYSV